MSEEGVEERREKMQVKKISLVLFWPKLNFGCLGIFSKFSDLFLYFWKLFKLF